MLRTVSNLNLLAIEGSNQNSRDTRGKINKRLPLERNTTDNFRMNTYLPEPGNWESVVGPPLSSLHATLSC